MSSYVDIDDVKTSLEIPTSDTTFDNDLEREGVAASQAIDYVVGRTFSLSADADDVRLYAAAEGAELGVLRIDDLSELTSVRVDPAGDGDWEAWTLDTDFKLQPVNAAALTQPWTSLRSLDKCFPRNRRAMVEVTGRFGWTSPPLAVVQAAGLLTKQLFNRDRSTPFPFVIAGDAAAVAYIARNDPHIQGLLQPFMRRTLLV